MAKRRYISLILVLLLSFLGFILRSQSREVSTQGSLKNVYNAEELRRYYQDSIPGLARAEELELIIPIHKTLPIPDTEQVLKLDRLWYGELGGYILYHIENTEEKTNLGGIVAKDNPVQADNNILGFVGETPEDGVIYNGGYYSFARLPFIDKSETFKDIIYKPVAYTGDSVYNFNSIHFSYSDIMTGEPLNTIEFDKTIEIEDRKLNLFKIQSGISYNRIYFTYDDPGCLYLYGIEGWIYNHKGSGLPIDGNTTLIGERDKSYYVNTEPFGQTPESIDLKISSLIFIGKDTINAEMGLAEFSGKKGLYTINKTLQRAYDMDIILNSIKIEDENVKMQIGFSEGVIESGKLDFEPMGMFSQDQTSLLSHVNFEEPNMPNIISIWNDLGGQPSYIDIISGATAGENSIELIIPLDFWQMSNRLFFSIENPMLNLRLRD